MKRTLALLTLLLVLPAFAAAQNQTRDRRSNETESLRTESLRTESTGIRARIVGTRAANHAEKQKANLAATAGAPSEPEQSRSPASPVDLNRAEPAWGNTSLVIRPGPSEPVAPLENSSANKRTAVDRGDQSVKKLVQQTSLATALPRISPAGSNASAPKTILTGGAAPTVVYHVGVGDVLDIRLTNLPTRESTLYTVLKSGFLEYPLLSERLSVSGMTTDEIANLLSQQIKVIKSARVSVTVRDYASHAVVITGLVDSPGRKTMRREAMPLFAVLAEALPRPEAAVATIVRDGNSQTVSLNNERSMSTLVLAGDIIKVSAGSGAVTGFVYVGGDVTSRGEKEFRDGMTLTQAILSAGGAVVGKPARVRVARRDANGFLRSNEYNLELIESGKSPDPLLEAGDRIELTQGM